MPTEQHQLSRFDIEKRADTPGDAMMLACSAPYVAYRYALDRGWITQAEHDAAKARYGNRWHYCGD